MKKAKETFGKLIEDLMETILSSISDAIIAFDRDEKVVYLNPQAERILKVKKAEIVGQKVEEIIENQELLSALQSFDHKEVSAKEERLELTQEVILPGEPPTILRILTTPLLDKDQKYVGYLKTFQDLTSEREIDRLKSEFLSTVSHDLRTPLTSIKGYVDLILDGDAGEISDIQREFLEIVKHNNDRLVKLINDVLDISKIESGRVHFRIEPIQLEDVVHDVIDTFKNLMAQKKIRLITDIPQALGSVAADQDRIGQVVMNLVSNALKYTPAGGTIEVNLKEEGHRLIFSVIDTGIGISSEDQKYLFTRFFRVDSSLTQEVGGSGLGLSICKSIINLHGGEIWIESELGQGSNFSFSLPLAVKGAPSKLKKFAEHDRKILVIDSDPDAARIVQRYLEKEGHSVIKAFDAAEALKVAREEEPNLITLDIMMEEMDGFELLQALKNDEKTKNIPVIILSIVTDEHKGYRLGAAGYLTKPVNQQKLVRDIENLLGQTKKRILLVDDDRDLVKLLTLALKRRGFKIEHAYNGLEAIVALKRKTPDLILLDLRMPEMDGYQVIEKLKKSPKTSQIPIIVMTAYHFDETKTDVLKLTAEQISKPFPVEILASKIQELLGRKLSE